MPDERIRKSDIDREREILEANIDEYPALRLLLGELPPDYDPETEPGDGDN